MFLVIRLIMVLFLLAALNLYRATKDKTLEDRIFGLILLFVLVHSVAIFPVYFLSNDYLYIESTAPFSLAYGPLHFFYQRVDIYGKLSRRAVILHTSPVFVFWLFYFVYISSSVVREHLGIMYYIVVYGAVAVSFAVYGAYLVFTQYVKHVKFSYVQFLYFFFLITSVFMFLLVFFLYKNKSGGLVETDNDTLGVNVGLYMLLAAMLIFSESTRRFRQQYVFSEKVIAWTKEKKTQKIETTLQPVSELNEGETEPLKSFFVSDAIRDKNLTLKTAAQELNMTQKTLMEMIRGQYNTTFAKLLTVKRVELACRMLLSPDFDESFDTLATACGFGSSASFYRNFKQLKGLSPMEFRREKRG